MGNIISLLATVNLFGEGMPSLDLDENHSAYQIRSYEPGRIQINEKILTESLIISPTLLMERWHPQTIQELTAESLLPIINLMPDILLIGTGADMAFVPPELYGELINHGIGVEIMSTGAACRTYNALSAENRRVVAALLIK